MYNILAFFSWEWELSKHDSALKALVRRNMTKWTQIWIYKHAEIWEAKNPLATTVESILATTACPDVVIIELKVVTLIELTVPHNSLESTLRVMKYNAEKKGY